MTGRTGRELRRPRGARRAGRQDEGLAVHGVRAPLQQARRAGQGDPVHGPVEVAARAGGPAPGPAGREEPGPATVIRALPGTRLHAQSLLVHWQALTTNGPRGVEALAAFT